MSEPVVTTPEPAAHVAQTLRALTVEIAELSQSEIEPSAFYAEFLERVIAGLAAHAGGVWMKSPRGVMELQTQASLERTLTLSTARQREQHAQLLAHAAAREQPWAVPPHAEVDHVSGVANPSPFVLLLCPLVCEGQTLGVVEIVQRVAASPAAQAGYLRFLGQLCAIAADYYQRHQARLLRAQQQGWLRFNELVSSLYRSLDVPATAFAIANEGCRYIGCDRLSVAVRQGRACRIAAVSGEDTVNPRATVVRRMSQLARVVAASGEPLWHSGDSSSLAPQVEQAVQEYLDESNARHLAVLPLLAPREGDETSSEGRGEIVGALILEQFASGSFQEAQRLQAQTVAQHAAASLHNAQQYHRLFLLPLWRALGNAAWVVRARTLPKTLLVVLALVGTCAALALVPADFDIEVRGRLEPKLRREIFVPMDGQIEEVHVKHGQLVEEGAPLVRLRNQQHEYQMASLLGEIQTVDKQLAARRATRLASDPSSPDHRNRVAQLAAEIEEFTAQQANLQRQLELLKLQAEELSLISPIRGQVITWNVTDLLAARPVQRGQSLLRVADTAGPWVLELNVPDRRIGHIREAERAQEGLSLTYLLASDTAIEYPAKVSLVAMSAEVDQEHGSAVRLVADLDPQESPAALRPGVSVIAKVHCGQRAVGYVWFHQLFEFVRSRVLFKL
jgi:multidrug efflux pump subunit AcrA (membrane-fusion protein)